MKLQYYTSVLSNNKTDTKTMWSILKEAIGKQNNKTSVATSFSINGINVTDKSQIANSFNDYFSQIGGNTSQMFPHPNIIANTICEIHFQIEPIITATTVETTRKLKTTSSSDHEEISTTLLKDSIKYAAVPITHIINRALIYSRHRSCSRKIKRSQSDRDSTHI